MKKVATICFLIVFAIFFTMFFLLETQNFSYDMDVVVVKSTENQIIGVDEDDELIIINSGDQDLRSMEKGQTVRVYYDGIITATYPPSVSGRVKLKNKEVKEISDRHLIYAYNSTSNVLLDMSDSTKKELVLYIEDNNSIKYLYNDKYEFSLYREGVNILEDEIFSLKTNEDGKMIGIFEFDEPLNIGKYSGKIIGKGEKSYLDIAISFTVNKEGLIENSKAQIEDISGNFKEYRK